MPTYARQAVVTRAARRVHRFYTEGLSLSVGVEVPLPAALRHQVNRVLRFRYGDRAIFFDGSGFDFTVEFADPSAGETVVRVVERQPNGAEPAVAVTLYVAPLKGDHFSWTLQKGTEVGAVAFVPVVTSRTIAAVDGAYVAKLERWRRIVREATEQSGRGAMPTVCEPLPFAEACQFAAPRGLALIAWEREQQRTLSHAVLASGSLTAVGLFIGPEGGFTPDEIAVARKFGIEPVTLGPRVLRAETAAVVATVATLIAAGDPNTSERP